MARLARVVVPGYPHHVTQRGNRRQQTFFCEDDYKRYMEYMGGLCGKHGVDIWAYCLMPNHVHLIAVPTKEGDLAKSIGEAHRRYTCHVNSREGWSGYLWQGRFASYPMDETYLPAAARYIEMNPVRAKLVNRAEEYPWSSANAHLVGKDNVLVKTKPLLDMVDDWAGFIDAGEKEEDQIALRRNIRTGRPLGGKGFIENLETILNRTLKRQKPGPNKK